MNGVPDRLVLLIGGKCAFVELKAPGKPVSYTHLQLIRTMLIPKPGCEFIISDFSAIEARVLAWEAREQWRLDAFQSGKDIYCESASQMFHVPVVKHGINGELRQKGKVAEPVSYTHLDVYKRQRASQHDLSTCLPVGAARIRSKPR